MGALRDKMMQDLKLAGYADSTKRIYIRSIIDLARFFKRSPEMLNRDDLRRWVVHLSERGDILLGHASLTTTMRYAKVSTALIQKTTSPLDRLPGKRTA